MHTLFVTGTDTSVGKTTICQMLLQAYAKHGYKALGLKPLASGCSIYEGKPVCRDADILFGASRTPEGILEQGLWFETAESPQVAAQKSGVVIDVSALLLYTDRCTQALDLEVCVIEGVGGWMVPLNKQEYLSDYVQILGASVLLVVPIKLGCVNHALLTKQAISASGCTYCGWVANCLDTDFLYGLETIALLSEMMGAPPLAVVPGKTSSNVSEDCGAFDETALMELFLY